MSITKETPDEDSSSAKCPPRFPAGVPYIIGNEVAERFSYYGMRSILVVYMTSALTDSQGQLAPLTEQQATSWFHLFTTATYFVPLFGALLADALLGKYLTIVLLSLVYCLGHLILAVNLTTNGLFWGLGLIALGAGGIKPCVSAHLGDQFDARSANQLERVFSWFYLGINCGAFIASLTIPYLFHKTSPHLAFGIPGAMMALATLIFIRGRTRFRAIPPLGIATYKQSFSVPENIEALKKLAILFLYIAIFWSLFDQTASTWVLQAQHMDCQLNVPLLGSVKVLPSQIQALNPLFVLLLAPVFSYVIYPWWNRFGTLTVPNKITLGMALAGLSFGICTLVQVFIEQGYEPPIIWQVLAYLILTSAEVLVSVTALEFSYTQAPKSMKSLVMSFYLLSVALGNALTAAINSVIELPGLSAVGLGGVGHGTAYFSMFTALMLFTALSFFFYSRNYKMKLYLH